MRTAIYTRISDDRAGDGLGVGRQNLECRELADRLGDDVVAVYSDNDISATTGKRRPDFERLLADLPNLDRVIVWATDRLVRLPKELERIIDALNEHHIDLRSVTQGGFDLTTPDGRMNARILGAVARREGEHAAARIRSKHRELAAAGLPHGGGPRPFGYCADRVTVDVKEAAYLREAADRILAGEGVRSIVTDWRARGVPTASGGRWANSNLKTTLIRPRNVGLREHNGALTTATWEPIFDEVTWRRVVAILTDPRRPGLGQRGRPMRMLTGLATCSLCGEPLKAQPRAGRHAYGCRRENGAGCGGVSISGEYLDDLIRSAVLAWLAENADALAAASVAPAPDDSAQLAELSRLAARREELDADRALGEITRDEYRRMIDVIERREAEVRTEIADHVTTDAPTALIADVAAAGADWDDIGTARQRAIIGALVESIVVKPTTSRGSHEIDPDRVDWTMHTPAQVRAGRDSVKGSTPENRGT